MAARLHSPPLRLPSLHPERLLPPPLPFRQPASGGSGGGSEGSQSPWVFFGGFSEGTENSSKNPPGL
eukprot:7352265-Pyramimonas_sp.AAC.1